MTFFDSFPPPVPPEPEPEPPPQPAWAKPDTMLGGAVAAQVVLARAEEAAVGLSGVVAYPNGFSFTVTIVLRKEDRRGHIFDVGFHRDGAGEPLSPELLRLGVQFADGVAVSNLGGYPHPGPATDPIGPVLLPEGGGGGGRRYEMTYWVSPLPPPGPVTFVCEWPAHGIAESRAVMEAGPIRDAAERAVPLWEQTGRSG